MATKATPGSLSSGTMLASDLIPCFLDALEELATANDDDGDLATVREMRKRTERDGYYDGEDADEDLNSLFDLLERYAPDGHYFGAHPGDGADYGFWPVEDYDQGDQT